MLKNILSLLLSRFYSKQESELVGHQAMPSASNTVITPSIKTECTTWSDAHIGIAPADGYLYVTGRTTNTDGFLQISSDTTEIAATTFGNTDKDIRLLFPLAKGQAMKVTAKSLKNIFLRFSSSIGGGYQVLKNALLQGGGQCLNSLSSSLRRSSWLARRSGLLNKAYHPLRRKLPSVSVVNPLEEIGLLSPRPTTVSFALWPTQTRSLSKTMLGRGRDNRGHKDTQEPMLCVPRVALSRINWELQRLLHLLFVSLLIPTAPLDSAVGGASC